MCSSDEDGYIPIKYIKEIENIQTVEQIEINSPNVVDKSDNNKRLSPFAQNYIPNRPTGMTSITIPCQNITVPKVTPYCGENYDKRHAWKDIQAKPQEYIETLTLQNENIKIIKDIPHDIPYILCLPLKTDRPTTTPPTPQVSNITESYIQQTTYYPTPQTPTETKQHTKSAYTTYHIPSTSERYIERIPCNDSKMKPHPHCSRTSNHAQEQIQEQLPEQKQGQNQEQKQEQEQ